MRQPDLISRSRADKKQPHRARGFIWSFVIHAALICGLIELSLFFQSKLALLDKGTHAGTQVISLEMMLVISPPAPPAPFSPAVRTAPDLTNVLAPRSPASTVNPALRPMPPEPVILPHPEIGLPVLARKRMKLLPAVPAKTGAPIHQTAAVASNGGGIGHLRPTGDKFVSSYAPGAGVLPPPPYPPEARELQESGIVRLLVEFDRAGNVALVEVVRSSGVEVLDRETRAFIRDNWHSNAFAGRSVRVPVVYALTSL